MKPESYFVPRHPALEASDLNAILATPLLIAGATRYWPQAEVPGARSLGVAAQVWVFTAGFVIGPATRARSAEELAVDAFVKDELRRREERRNALRGPSGPARSVAGTALHIAGHIMADSGAAIGWLGLPVAIAGALVEGKEPELPPIPRAFWDDVNRRRLEARIAAGAALDVVSWPEIERVAWGGAHRWIVREYFMSFVRAARDAAPPGYTWTAHPDYRLITAGEAMLARLRHEISSLSLRFIGTLLGVPHYEAFRERELQRLRAKHEESWPFSGGDVVEAIGNVAPPDECRRFTPQTMLRDVGERLAPLTAHYARVPDCAPVIEKLATA